MATKQQAIARSSFSFDPWFSNHTPDFLRDIIPNITGFSDVALGTVPKVEWKDSYEFSVDLPGYKITKLETLNNKITIEANREGKASFTQVVIYSADIDTSTIEASFIDGVLTVKAKKPEEKKPTQIQVQLKR